MGEHPVSPIFPQQRLKSTTTPELLLKTAAWRNQAMAATPIHSDEPELAAKLWEVTNQEVQRGFLKGPYENLDQLQRETGCPNILVNRRFLLIQGEAGKPRAIDDCKTSGFARLLPKTTSWCCKTWMLMRQCVHLWVAL